MKEINPSKIMDRRTVGDAVRAVSTEDYKKAVDDLVNVNKLFTLAVFLGLSLATAGQRSLENRAECDTGTSVAKRLIVFEVLSFSCFLSSTLVAMAIKLHLNIYGGGGGGGKDSKDAMNSKGVREMMVVIAGLASFFAYFFLMLSMVDIIQIRLGLLSCRGAKSLVAAVTVISIVSVALLIFPCLMLFPLYNSISLVQG